MLTAAPAAVDRLAMFGAACPKETAPTITEKNTYVQIVYVKEVQVYGPKRKKPIKHQSEAENTSKTDR